MGVRNIILSIVPKSWAISMEAESRAWMMKCETCSYEMSVWEAGGLRWKAKGNPRRMVHCQKCGQMRMHTTYLKK
ncbi:MAG: hypothetical protein HY774_19740 [Acidobacteria bacterium]|nr:hypothetical protein [Acidobacteriota bacterium]